MKSNDTHEKFIQALENEIPAGTSLSLFASQAGVDAACLSRFRNGKAASIKPENLNLLLERLPTGSRAVVAAAYLETQIPAVQGCSGVRVVCEGASRAVPASERCKARRKRTRK